MELSGVTSSSSSWQPSGPLMSSTFQWDSSVAARPPETLPPNYSLLALPPSLTTCGQGKANKPQPNLPFPALGLVSTCPVLKDTATGDTALPSHCPAHLWTTLHPVPGPELGGPASAAHNPCNCIIWAFLHLTHPCSTGTLSGNEKPGVLVHSETAQHPTEPGHRLCISKALLPVVLPPCLLPAGLGPPTLPHSFPVAVGE